MLALLIAGFVANLVGGNSLTLPAQRHIVQVNGTYLMAVQQEGADGHGLSFYRSDDGANSWAWYAPIQDDPSESDTTDILVNGSDLALVWSYEGPEWLGSNVWFQWWRFDGGGNWAPSAPVQVFSGAFQRAELAIDSKGFIWVQAFSLDGGGSTAVISVSTDGGNSFSQQPSLASVGNRGGGRLISLGSQLMFLFGSHGFDPGRMMLRNDSDPLGQWNGPIDVFGEGLYHGAALSAVADGGGGLHLAYKDLNEQLWYRHYDGSGWGDPLLVEGNSDWALQPTTTVTGDGVVICFNHPITVDTNYQLWSRTVSGGSISDPVVLDGSAGFKGYPSAPETGAAACGYSQTPDANTSGSLQLVFGN